MCRLFGLIASEPVDVKYWMLESSRPLIQLASKHSHGWGIGWYDNRLPDHIKEPVSALDSPRFTQTVVNTRSDLFVCHIRLATRGERTVCNSHPFQSGAWLFGHNGSLGADYLKSNLDDAHRAQLGGETDSEMYFQWLLQNFERDPAHGFEDAIRSLRQREFTALNFVMSDGDHLYAYWEQSPNAKPPTPDYYQLYLTSRSLDQFSSPVHNPEFAPRPNTLSGVLGNSRRAVIISSETLDDGPWQQLPGGHLVRVSKDLTWSLSDLR